MHTEKLTKELQKKIFNRKRTTQTPNIHKSSVTKDNMWKVILGNLTLITQLELTRKNVELVSKKFDFLELKLFLKQFTVQFSSFLYASCNKGI